MTAEPQSLRVMLAFAGTNRPDAIELREALLARKVDAFVDADIPPGQDIVHAINEAIDRSDYFVLLWSANAVGNWYVQTEYAAAYMRGPTEQRPFLHVVRLDATPPPRLLSAIKYLDADGDWNAIADRLLEAWQGDDPADPDRPTINVQVCNEDLSVSHRIGVPVDATAQDLLTAVRARLHLRDRVTAFEGQIGARLFYRLEKDGRQLVANDSLAAAGITGGSRIDLRVQAEWFGPHGLSADATFRDGEPAGLSAAMRRHLFDLAFDHLRQLGNGSQPTP